MNALWKRRKIPRMNITPELETYFLSFSLTQDISSLVPPPGTAERHQFKNQIAYKMERWSHVPPALVSLARAYRELGVIESSWFFEHLAEAYITWLSTVRIKAPTV